MDWWMVAAATGTGYAARYLQNFLQDREGVSGVPSGRSFAVKPDSSSLIQQMHEKNFFLQKSAEMTDQQPYFDRGKGSLPDGGFQEPMSCSSPLLAEKASASGIEGDYCDDSKDICETSTGGMDNVKGLKRERSFLRSRRSNLLRLKPLNSLESCLMAQLYKEHAEMEEHVLAPLPSPCTPALRPFLVTDGTHIISRSSCDSSNVEVRDGKDKPCVKVYPEANEAVFDGVPRLLEIKSEKGSREKNAKKRNFQNGKLSSFRRMDNEKRVSPQGSPSGAVIFCLGISVGIIYSLLANKAEVTKLHDLLKQTENLVQDLQEELEMKDSITVVEVVNEDNAFPYVNENSADKGNPTKPLVLSDSDALIKYDLEASDSQKEAETIESISTIEAELEAELERLELNMKKSTQHGRFSDDDGLNPDFVAEVVQGELRADMLSRKASSDTSLVHSSSSISTPCSPKHAVSPRELSIRLHQVIQSRLEQRIMELEAALEKSQKRIVQLQSEQHSSRSRRGFSHTDMSSSSSSTRGSPITIGSTPTETQPQAPGAPPLVINLSGEALDAYNEACQEFKKISQPANKEPNFAVYRASQGEQPFGTRLIGKHNGTENGSFLIQPEVTDPKTSMAGSRIIEQSEKFCMYGNEDEIKDEDDEMTQLIMQIVEKARRGSPAVLHAHKAMFHLDKNEE